MRANQQDLYQKVTNIILQLLESMQEINRRSAWVNVDAGAPINVISKREYRGINWLLLSFISIKSGYNVNRWLSFKQAKELGGHVRKGEKSTPVILYKKTYFDKHGNKYSPEQVESMSREEFKQKEMTVKTLLAEFPVFNVAQVEGLPSELYLSAQRAPFTEFQKDEQAESLLTLSGAKINYQGNMAFYSPQTDEITLPPRNQFRGAEPFYEVAFHELAHWTGHPNRLNRGKKHDDNVKAYALEELIAELTTAFVCSGIGFESFVTKNAASYLQTWIKVLKEDNRVILKICVDAQKAADLILQPLKESVGEAA